jgi:hypothetical protein
MELVHSWSFRHNQEYWYDYVHPKKQLQIDVGIDRVALIHNYSNLNIGILFSLHDEEQAFCVPGCVGISVAVIQFCYYHCGLLYDRLLLINIYSEHKYWIFIKVLIVRKCYVLQQEAVI